MNLEWWQIAVAVGGVAYVAWNNRDKLKGLLGGILPTATKDATTERVMLALQLRAACEKACPEAIKHIDQAIPHLLPGHTEATT